MSSCCLKCRDGSLMTFPIVELMENYWYSGTLCHDNVMFQAMKHTVVFCRIPSAEIITLLEVFLLIQSHCKANFSLMSYICSAWSTLLFKVCILLVFTSVMFCCRSLAFRHFECSIKSLYISYVFILDIISAKILFLPFIWTRIILKLPIA